MSPLITPEELAAIGDAAILDVRWRLGGPPGVEAYREGHIPGAVFCDLNADLAAPPGPAGRHPLPAPEAFQESMRRLGVSEGRPVVVYDEADSTAAARAWWTLRYFGHGDVRVLDGGLRAWTRAGLPVTKEEGPVPPGDFTARPGGMPVMDADQAAALAADGVLLDARAAERYRGEVEPVDPVAGTSPARSAPRQPGTSSPAGGSTTGSSSASASTASGRSRACPSARTAGRGSRPPTRCSHWRSPGCRPPCTSAPGPTGSPTPPGRSRPADGPPAQSLAQPAPD